jgi:hypothetical protein
MQQVIYIYVEVEINIRCIHVVLIYLLFLQIKAVAKKFGFENLFCLMRHIYTNLVLVYLLFHQLNIENVYTENMC